MILQVILQIYGREHRGSNLTAGTTKRLFTLTAALCVCLTLGACGSFSGFVADTWPTWAGGMPKDVPPRPGAPGYEEFIAHQQRQDVPPNTGAVPGAPGRARDGHRGSRYLSGHDRRRSAPSGCAAAGQRQYSRCLPPMLDPTIEARRKAACISHLTTRLAALGFAQ